MDKINTVRATEESVFLRSSINRACNTTETAKERDLVMSYRNHWTNKGNTGETVSTVSGTGPPSLH
jgi:hypothetical protein